MQMEIACRMQQRYEEERLQRLVQEEAMKFLWMQVSHPSYVHQNVTLICEVFFFHPPASFSYQESLCEAALSFMLMLKINSCFFDRSCSFNLIFNIMLEHHPRAKCSPNNTLKTWWSFHTRENTEILIHLSNIRGRVALKFLNCLCICLILILYVPLCLQ